MKERVKGYWDKVREFVKKIPKRVLIALAVLLVVAVVLVAILNHRTYQVLFTDLNSTEMSSILGFLEDSGVTDYRVQNNDTILVPDNQESALKAKLLMEGYGTTGFGYTYSQSAGALATETERSRAELRDLQDRMGAVIECMDGIKEAVVTINAGEDNSYILDTQNKINATASVLVTMNNGGALPSKQANAIRNLVAHAVKGLDISSVSIHDSLGNTYSGGEIGSDNDASALKIRLEEEWENKIRTDVMNLLGAAYGTDNVRVAVNCTVDIGQRTVNTHEVHLPEYAEDGSTDGQGIIGSRIYEYAVNRPGDDTVGGLVGSETNSDISEYVEDLSDPNGEENSLYGSGQVDYDNSTTDTVALYTAGYLTDCSIAVSINSDVAGTVNIDQMRQHIARAAGIVGTVDQRTGEEFLEDKISVVTLPFFNEPPPVVTTFLDNLPVPLWVLIAAAGGLLLFLVVLIVILSIRRKKKKEAARLEEMDRYLAEALPGVGGPVGSVDNGADVMEIDSERSLELRQEIRKFAEDNPELTAQMLKIWLRGGDENA